MKSYGKLLLWVVSLLFVAQYGYTGSVSPPANVWFWFPAQENVDMNSNNIKNTNQIEFSDSTNLTTSPEKCASGKALNTTGCEGVLTTILTDTGALTPGDTVASVSMTLEDKDRTWFYVSGLLQLPGDWTIQSGDPALKSTVNDTTTFYVKEVEG